MLLVLAAASCGNAAEQEPASAAGLGQTPPPAITIAVDSGSLAAGGTLQFRLVNGSMQNLGYNLCTARLERRASSGWTAVVDDRVCTMELRVLAPGDTARSLRILDRGLESGDYRIVARVHLGETFQDVASAPFTVAAAR
jgi:hypothetical protein